MQAGDRAAVTAVCEREHRRLVGILTLHTGDPWVAEELANEVLVALCERWAGSPPIEDPRAWVTRVALNHANSWIRRRVAERRARARLERLTVGDAAADGAPGVDGAEDGAAVRAAVAALPRRQREAVVLRYWDGMSADEAGAVMGVDAGTVRALTHQAVTALRGAFTFDPTLEHDREHDEEQTRA
ncbi:MAG: RNA polymerase sigma factor [Actinomycetes bacterium]